MVGPKNIEDLREEIRASNISTRSWAIDKFGEQIRLLEVRIAALEERLEKNDKTTL